MAPSKSKSNTLYLILIIIATLIVSITAILISIFGCRGTPIVPIANEEEDETEITEHDAGIDIESSSSNNYNDRVTIDEIDDVLPPIGQVEQWKSEYSCIFVSKFELFQFKLIVYNLNKFIYKFAFTWNNYYLFGLLVL